MPDEGPLNKAPEVHLGIFRKMLSCPDDKDRHVLESLLRIDLRPEARVTLRVQPHMDDTGTTRHSDLLFIDDSDGIFVNGDHSFQDSQGLGFNSFLSRRPRKTACSARAMAASIEAMA